MGVISIPITIGKDPKHWMMILDFYIIDSTSPYNIMLGIEWLTPNKAIYSSYHLAIKFPTENRFAEVWGDQKVSKDCMKVEVRRDSNATSKQDCTTSK